MSRPRSVLSVPASNARMMAKAADIPADAVFFDLEDAVAPSEKESSRIRVIEALLHLDWTGRAIGYRANGTLSPHFYRDVIDVVEQAGQHVSFIILPKVERASELQALDLLLTQIEMAHGLQPGRIRVEAIIESPGGLVRIHEIAAATPRLQSLIFGPGDFAALMRIPTAGIGVGGDWDRVYPGHRFQYAMGHILVAARAAELHAIDGPVADVRNLDAYRQSSMVARALGYDGKWCIHPSQVPVANEVFSPSKSELAAARTLLDAYDSALNDGVGAIALDGQMIDAASVRMAREFLNP